jgi:tRNA(Arg) A34 adenosine deaminase TadA
MTDDHGRFMRLALEEATRAAQAGDAPVGAVVIRNGEVIARGRNRKTTTACGTAHAEMNALLEAAPVLGRRPSGVVLYSTLEPCAMCLGAACFAGIETLVFGARDEVGGAVELFRGHPAYARWMPEIVEGVMSSDCEALLEHPAMREKRVLGGTGVG